MTHMDRWGRAALGISLIGDEKILKNIDEDIDFRCLPALVEVKVVDREDARRLLSDFSLNNNDHSRNQVVQPSRQVVNIIIRWSNLVVRWSTS